jgi:hypothetical protein
MFQNLKAVLFVLTATFALSQQALASGTETYVGIGITINKSHDSFQIVDLIPTGPAINAGVRIGDWVTAVDAKPTAKLKIGEIVKMIGGEVGTPVTLTLEDDKTRASRDVPIVRANVTIDCVLKGNISLNYFGDAQNGTLSGYIGQDSIYLNVFSGRISGMIDREFVNLQLESQSGFGLTITGFIRGSYITWRGNGNSFFGYQECIY